MFEDTELADTVIHFDGSITQGIGRHEPLVIVAAVAFIHDTAVVCLDDAVVFELKKQGVIINDLYSLVINDRQKYISSDGIHMNEDGIKILGDAVVENIKNI